MERSPTESFLLRAHHVARLPLPGEKDGAAQIAEAVADNTADSEPEEFPTYAVDVLGDTPAQRQKYQDGLLDTLTEFQRLPDEAPLRLAVGVIDSICRACAFGVHCTRPENAEIDAQILSEVEEVASELDCTERVVVGHNESDPAAKWLDTDAGTLRAVLSYARYGNKSDA